MGAALFMSTVTRGGVAFLMLVLLALFLWWLLPLDLLSSMPLLL
jgi:hypothetical protein